MWGLVSLKCLKYTQFPSSATIRIYSIHLWSKQYLKHTFILKYTEINLINLPLIDL